MLGQTYLQVVGSGSHVVLEPVGLDGVPVGTIPGLLNRELLVSKTS